SQLRKRPGDVAIERFAVFRQPQAARGALQQARAQLLFQARDRCAQARLGAVECPCRGREAAVLDHLAESVEVVPVHCSGFGTQKPVRLIDPAGPPSYDCPIMFLKNCWYVAAWDHELIDGKLLPRTLLEERVLLYKGESGKVVALKDRCCHRGAPLSLGRLEGDCIRCMYHGLKFDPTGKCIQIPGQDNIPAKLGVRSYPVVERDHLVWIWMGEPELANPDDILDFPYLRDPQWKGIPGYLHYDANYLLIVDNLSDFAHLAFVHTKTLGGSEEYAYVTKPVVMERQERGLKVERWHMNAPPPPFHKK